jgi:hydrogenase nickel incorporation protein HypB
MCTMCGCGGAATVASHDPSAGLGVDRGHDDGHTHPPHHGHNHGHSHDHGHGHDHDHHHDHGHAQPHSGLGDAPLGAVHAPGVSRARIVRVETELLSENDRLAAANRAYFKDRGILALNLVSSPGSGKTTLLVRTIGELGKRVPIAVIEGDQQTSFDADRIRSAGAPSVQINTGKGCHLDALMVSHAVQRLPAAVVGSLLFIENVGNLVCPAAFDLGEAAKVVMLSVTEGEDKPLKYPDMFHASQLLLLTKIDLLPHVPFDVERCFGYARRVNPAIEMLPVSALTGDGLADWYGWIARRRHAVGTETEAAGLARAAP